MLVPVAPCIRVRLPGKADRLKLGGGARISAIVVELVSEPEVPVIVKVKGPTAPVLLVLSVRVLVFVVLGGLKDAVTPVGKPEADKLTFPVKPF